MRTTLTLILLLLPAMAVAADKLADRDERVNRIVKAGGMFTFDNRKKDRPPVTLRIAAVPTQQMLDDIKSLHSLQSVHAEIYQTSDRDLEPLASLSHLKALTILGDFRDDSVKHLSSAMDLEQLAIGSRSITNASLAVLGQLPKLNMLVFKDCPRIDDEGLKLLRPAEELRALNLNGLKLDGSGFADLKPLPHLETLWLSGTTITDSGLRHIEAISGLRSLELTYPGTVTKEGLAALSRKRPRLQIKT